MLKYFTRGDDTPKGKPRVYVCCHPAEQAMFLEPVAKEILAIQNCAVWYMEDPNEERNETFWSDLAQMQLLVMPVTSCLLTGENIALEEFQFAVKQHIPVLPLMQESGLVERFNQVCGELQFLDKNAADDTAISYREKLEKFLSDVLIGDELAGKIRAAFDAYVFLSYRKKDRRYAQELMRLIHKNEFARDIAIWYDEFLVPGENFNEAICQAMEKCHLFAMAVTPNLVCEPNYIQETEYPMAKEKGKPILPVEMLPTDRAALKRQYAGIPDCTDGYDELALSDALLAQFCRLARSEEKGDPEHTYLIGLAYLGGIDVEVDHQRALKLFESAADGGLAEAMGKLAQMYRDGLGVAVDPVRQIAWENRLLEKLEDTYTTEKTADTFTAYLRELVHVAQERVKIRRQREAIALYETVIRLCQEPTEAYDVKEHFTAYIFSLQHCGAICVEERAYEKAAAYLNQAMTALKDCAGNGVAAITVEILRSVGRRYHDLGRYDEAGEAFLSMIKLCREQEQELGCSYANRNAAVAFWELGKNLEAQKNREEARAAYQSALKGLHAAAMDDGYRVEALRDMVIVSCSLALLEERLEKYDAAADAWNAAVLQIRQIPEWERDGEITGYMCNLINQLGDFYNRRLDWERAREAYAEARSLKQAFRAQPMVIQMLWNNFARKSREADRCKEDGKREEAKAAHLQALEYAMLLAEKEGSIHASYDVWTELEKLVSLLGEMNDPDMAQYMQRSLGLIAALAVENDTTAMYDQMTRQYIRSANYFRKTGDIPNAYNLYKTTKAISEKRLKVTASYSCMECLAEANLGIGLVGKSREFVESAHKMWSILCDHIARSHPEATEQLRRYQKSREYVEQILLTFENA